MYIFKKLQVVHAIILTLMILSNQTILPLAAPQPVSAETIQIESTPSVQPIRLSQIREIDPEPTVTIEIDQDLALSRSGSEIASQTSKAEPTPTPKPKPEYQWMTFSATFYAGDQKGLNPQLRTATGTRATAGRTIAVDPRVIPYGTKVYIEGWGYRIAEDCGGFSGKHIDIFVDHIADIPRAGKIRVRLRIVS